MLGPLTTKEVTPVKGDFSRQTFARKNHYSSVRMQQGRVQLDADWNEQADIVTHRSVTAQRDLIGPCGGPLKGAAFQVRTIPGRVIVPPVEVPGRTAGEDAERPAAEVARRPGALASDARARVVNPSSLVPVRPPIRGVTNVGDFILGAGRYYVAGILCENEQDVRFSKQPDLPQATTLGDAPYDAEALYLLYLDVWQRHLTALDDSRIRETALGGPDTATRTKTVWQAKLWKVPAKGGVVCPDVFGTFMRTEAGRNTGLLNASSVPEDPGSNPCIVPPSAGYRGLENLLYRVEIHTGGQAADVSTNVGSVAVTSFGSSARNELTVESGPTPKAGDAVDLYAAKSGSDPMKGRLYFVTGVNGQTLTLSRDIQGLEISQQPRLRKVSATFKWSRQNGVVVTKIENVSSEDNKQITVQSLGPDDDLGFSDGDWVELTDDVTELHGRAGQLTQIVSADSASRTVVLKDAPIVAVSRNAKMRRWDGLGPVRLNPADADRNWIELENGLRIQFPQTGVDESKPGEYATGDHWLIPTRTATADRESGQIEWPLDAAGRPQSQPPAGIEHHYCPLALLNWNKTNGVTVVSDCRRLFPAVTELTTLDYVSGTGQEATPVLAPPAQSLVELLHPLVVGVSNGSAPVAGARVVFEVVEGEINAAAPAVGSDFPNGRLSAVAGGSALVISDTKIEVRTGSDGLASCKWELSTGRWNQQVVATLLGDDARTPIHLPVRFNANLSIASEVAYKPGKCDKLAGFRTVQDALDELCRLVGLSDEPGVHVVDVEFGAQARRLIEGERKPGEAGPIRPGLPGVDERELELPDKPDGKIENDFDLTCDALAEGLRVTCDRDIFQLTIRGKPTCFVTLELPYPFSQSDKQAWGLKPEEKAFIGYQSIVLDGDPKANGKVITWRPSSFTANWLRDILTVLFDRFDPKVEGSRRPGRILGRLTLKGNFIWSHTDPKLYLDGDLFGVAEADGDITAARAPSGDGKRGGDLELWFWLVNFELRLEKEEINVGEATTGVVSLSGPAPRGGTTVALTISDATVAKLRQTTVNFKEGEVDGTFEVEGHKQGEVTISARYAEGLRKVGLSVSVSPPPRVEAVRIHRRESTLGNAELAKMDTGTGLPLDHTLTVSVSNQPNVIEVKFTDDAPVNFSSITNKTFVVLAVSTEKQIAGKITPVAGSNALMWKTDLPLPAGDYQITFFGEVGGITSAKGKRLDGEPKQLPSGEGKEGGNFSFVLRVQASQPTASLLKVRRVRILNRNVDGFETVLFESKEGVFNASIPLKQGEQGERPNIIEFEFTGGPVNKASVRDGATLLVRRMITGRVGTFELQQGVVNWPTPTPSVVRWIKAQPLAPGLYNVALLGGNDPVVNVTASDNIKATDGRTLDGEPKQLPSGDNAEGGTFAFTLQIT
jgi:hypothetical protein